jgi:hypothetical protein
MHTDFLDRVGTHVIHVRVVASTHCSGLVLSTRCPDGSLDLGSGPDHLFSVYVPHLSIFSPMHDTVDDPSWTDLHVI